MTEILFTVFSPIRGAVLFIGNLFIDLCSLIKKKLYYVSFIHINILIKFNRFILVVVNGNGLDTLGKDFKIQFNDADGTYTDTGFVEYSDNSSRKFYKKKNRDIILGNTAHLLCSFVNVT